MIHKILKDFWINKINNLITNFSVDPNTLDAGADWVRAMNDMAKWLDIDHFGKNICQDVYVKAGKVAPKSFTKGENYGKFLDDSFTDLDLKFADLVDVYKTRLGIDPLDDTTVKSGGKDVLEWKWKIGRKFPHTDRQYTLKDMGDLDLLDLLYERDLYLQITNNLNDLILKGSNLSNAYGYKGWKTKVNNTALQNYKNAKTTITNAETHLGLNSGELATITTNATYNLNGKTLAQLLTPHACPPCSTHADYDTIKGESTEYQRIHTKLNGKVSDDDLDNLLNSDPSCSHSDYDAIKQALANEKEKLTKKEESWELEKKEAQAEKEKEIINKIITDLGLTTERERECFRSSDYRN